MKLQTCPGQILQGQASFFFLVRRPLGGCCGPGPDSRGEGGGSLARGPGQGFGAKCQFLFELARWGTPSPPGICPGGGGDRVPRATLWSKSGSDLAADPPPPAWMPPARRCPPHRLPLPRRHHCRRRHPHSLQRLQWTPMGSVSSSASLLPKYNP